MLEGAIRSAEARGMPRLFAVESEYVQALRRAELDFVQRLVKDIESGELTGIDQWRGWYAPGGERSTDEHRGPGPS